MNSNKWAPKTDSQDEAKAMNVLFSCRNYGKGFDGKVVAADDELIEWATSVQDRDQFVSCFDFHLDDVCRAARVLFDCDNGKRVDDHDLAVARFIINEGSVSVTQTIHDLQKFM